MLFPFLYPIILGLLNAANTLDFPGEIKGGMLAIGMGVLFLDMLFCRKDITIFDPWSRRLFVALFIFQLLYLYQTVFAIFVKGGPQEFSFSAFALQGIAPFIWILIASKKPWIRFLPPHVGLLLGIFLAVMLSVGLSFTPLGDIYTQSKYDTDSFVGVDQLAVARHALPLFPGMVPGGLFCALGVVLAAVVLMSPNKRRYVVILAIAWVFLLAAILGVFRTGTRGGIIFAILSIGLLFLIRNKSRLSLGRTVGLLLIGFSIALPWIYNTYREVLLSFASGALESFLTRGLETDAMTLGGRALIWEQFGVGIDSFRQVLIGNGPYGELALGLNEEFNLAVHGFYSPNIYLSHFHNMTMNLFYATGLVGVFIFWWSWFLAWMKCWYLNCELPQRLCFLAVLVFLAASGSVDSLLSVGYEQFAPLFVIAAASLLRNDEWEIGEYDWETVG